MLKFSIFASSRATAVSAFFCFFFCLMRANSAMASAFEMSITFSPYETAIFAHLLVQSGGNPGRASTCPLLDTTCPLLDTLLLLPLLDGSQLGQGVCL